jgi:hypothetical protein
VPGLCKDQDAYFIVVSKSDPGVNNWIETAELSEGLLAGRLQSVDPSAAPDGINCNLPVAITVPPAPGATLQQRVAGTLLGLGASFTLSNDEFREDTLKMRQNFVREKYIFW